MIREKFKEGNIKSIPFKKFCYRCEIHVPKKKIDRILSRIGQLLINSGNSVQLVWNLFRMFQIHTFNFFITLHKLKKKFLIWNSVSCISFFDSSISIGKSKNYQNSFEFLSINKYQILFIKCTWVVEVFHIFITNLFDKSDKSSMKNWNIKKFYRNRNMIFKRPWQW